MSRLLRSIAILAGLAFAGAAQANTLVEQIVHQLEANPANCATAPEGNADRQLIESDVAHFLRVAKVPPDVHFEILDCADDGFVYQGRTIVVSTRMARLAPAQRFFILAHELGHVHLMHHAATNKFVAQAVRKARGDERTARARIASSLAQHSHQAEFDADAFAVRLMREAGIDPEEAAQLFDSLGEGKDNATHPSAGRRARAIRSVL